MKINNLIQDFIMLLLINAVQAAMDLNKDLTPLKTSKADLSSLNGVFISGLPKLTLSQNIFEKGNQLIKRFNPTYPTTQHVIYKGRIKEVLGWNIYHAVKVKGYIKDKLKNLSNTEFARLKRRCDKIRSPQHLLGVFTEIMHEGRKVPLLKEEQLEQLLASWPGLKKVIDKGVQTFNQEATKQGIKLKEKISLKEEQLFVIQTIYDLDSENNITPEKWNRMDRVKKKKLFSLISEGNINSCLEKRSRFEKTLFAKSPDKKKLKELKSSIHQAVKVDLCSLEYPSISDEKS
ncbi:hypothetical protein [Candidatus Rhabdochlamydia sp. W815]|nr:hypothetical protein [Candidatus Rhabdochlamydia sp. W815]